MDKMGDRKGKTYEEYYGIKKAKEIKLKMSIKRNGRKPMLGKHHSIETKRKFSEMRKGENNSFYGKKHTNETKEKIRKAELGENHWNWKGGNTPYYKSRLDDYKWHDITEKVKRRDNYICQLCGKEGKDIHHILPHWFFNGFNPKGLITLCKSCHKKADWKTKYIYLYLISQGE